MIMIQLHRANEEIYKTMWAGFRPCDNIVDFTSVSNEPINIHSWPWLINTFIDYYNTLHQGVRIRSCNNKVYYMVWQNFWTHSIRTQLACNIATVPVCSTDTLANVLPHKNAMPQRHMTWHPSQYSYTGPNYRAFHWRGTLYWSTQLPIVLFDWETLPRPSTHKRTLNFMILIWW